MSQKIKVQDGNIQYSGVPSDTNPLGEIDFAVNGQINVSNEIVVGSVNSPIDGVVSTGNGTALERARLDITTGTYGDLSIYQSPTDGKLFLNNAQWPTGATQPSPGMFLGSTDFNTLEYLSFALGQQDDSWTVPMLNATYPDASPGQFVVGTTVLYMCVSTGLWRILGSGLSNTGVVPGLYLNAEIEVDAQGRITYAADGTASSAPIEYITELSNGFPMFSDGSYYYNWYLYDQQLSPDVTGFSNGTASASQFTLNTPGSYKITITSRIRSVNYPGVPAGALPTGAMLYGVQLIGTYANFDLSTHTSGTSAAWAANGIQNQLQWTDTFYVMMYDTNPVNFYIGVYANTVDGLFEYNPACMVSVLRTVGTPIQPN